MERYVSNPNVDKSVVNTVEVYEGGTGGTTVPEAQENLDILPKELVGVPGGLAILPEDGLYGEKIEGGKADTPTIEGPTFVRTNQTNRFFITNYDIKTDYTVSATMGTIERQNDYLIFKSGPDVGTAKIKLNNLEVDLPIYLAQINMPFIIAPLSGSTDNNSRVDVRTSAFVTAEKDTRHAATDWQVSTTVTMDALVKNVEKDTFHLTSWRIDGLLENITYYIRFRYWDSAGNKSSWSEITQFKTRETFHPFTPVILQPSDGAVDQKADVVFVGNPFFSYETTEHHSSDWQLSTNAAFTQVVSESKADTLNLTSWKVNSLNPDTVYFARVRYTDKHQRTSVWSGMVRITTKKSFAAEPPVILYPNNLSTDHSARVTVLASNFSGADERVQHQSTDWEIAEDNSFQYPAVKSYSNGTEKVEWTAKKLLPGKTYFVRARYRDSQGYVTGWSEVVQFKTRGSFTPGRPTVTEPVNGKEGVGPWIDLRSSAFVSNNDGDEHLNSDWEIGTTGTFTDLAKWNTATSQDRITWKVKRLEPSMSYFIRVRHRASIDGVEYVSEWSPTVRFATKTSFAPGRPTITYPKSGSKDVSSALNITSSGYVESDSQDTHVNSDWEISTNSGFTDIVQSNHGSAVAKTMWQVSGLKSLTTLFVRVRHRTVNDGVYYASEWSSAVNFTVVHNVPAKPVILTPTAGSTKVPTSPLFTCSAFIAGEKEEKHLASTWEIALDVGFTNVVVSSIGSSVNKVSWKPEGLNTLTNYFVRVKHIGTMGFQSEWSEAVNFSTKAPIVTQAPTITFPLNNAPRVSLTPKITTTDFATSDRADSHLSSDWELAEDQGFTTILLSNYESYKDRTTWMPEGLVNSKRYYVRVRHCGTESGLTDWSTPVGFTTRPVVYNQAPAITFPLNNAIKINKSVEITTSTFATSDPEDTHRATDWDIATDENFLNIVASIRDSMVYKTKWAPPGLQYNTKYYVRAKHYGIDSGATGWSNASSFTTRDPVVIKTPEIIAPQSGGLISPTAVVCSATAFESETPGETHEASHWEISEAPWFDVIVKSSYAANTNLTTWTPTGFELAKTYYIRVKYVTNSGAESDWSNSVSFATKTVSIPGSNGIVKYNLYVGSLSYGRGPGWQEGSVVEWSWRRDNVIFARNADHVSFFEFNGSVDPYRPVPNTSVLNAVELNHDGTFKKDDGSFNLSGALGRFGPLNVFIPPDKSKIAYIYKSTWGSQGNTTVTKWWFCETGSSYWSNVIETDVDRFDPRTKAYTPIKFQEAPDGATLYHFNHFDCSTNFEKTVYSANYFGIITDPNGGSNFFENRIYVYSKLQRDDGKKFQVVTRIMPPAGNYPANFGYKQFLSGNGKVLFAFTGANFIYIYEETEAGWSYVEKIQTPGEENQFDVCEDGRTFIVSFKGKQNVAVYTRTSGSWNNSFTINPGGVENGPEIDGFACINDNGNVISVNGNSADRSKIYFYARQNENKWGEIGFIEEIIPNGATKVGGMYHRLSRDGSSCAYLTPAYTMVNAANGKEVYMNSQVCIAK